MSASICIHILFNRFLCYELKPRQRPRHRFSFFFSTILVQIERRPTIEYIAVIIRVKNITARGPHTREPRGYCNTRHSSRGTANGRGRYDDR